jgi:hypothetical protein
VPLGEYRGALVGFRVGFSGMYLHGWVPHPDDVPSPPKATRCVRPVVLDRVEDGPATFRVQVGENGCLPRAEAGAAPWFLP